MEHFKYHGISGGNLAMFAVLSSAVPCASLSLGNVTFANMHTFADAAHAQEGQCIHVGPEYSYYCGRARADGGPQPLSSFTTALVKSNEYGGGICSQFGQDWILAEIFEKIGTTNKYFVEFGARAPQILNSAHFRLNCGWSGLLMDGYPGMTPDGGGCPGCADLYELLSAPDNAPVRMRQAILTQENVNDVFSKMNVPRSLDLLTVDIDGNDYWVLKGLDMNKFLPRVVVVEFSSYFTKDQPYVQKYDPKRVWQPPYVCGSSLAALDGLMQSRGYSFVTQVAGEHAIWVLDTALDEKDRRSTPIPDRVNEGWQAGNVKIKREDFQIVDAPTVKLARLRGSSQQVLEMSSNATFVRPGSG